jgi:uncharacterized protein YuzE
MTKSRIEWAPVRYFPDTDTMAIELRPWPGLPGESGEGEDAGSDLVIHYYPGDGKPWLWEIEHASQHPEHIAAALKELQSRRAKLPELHTINELKLFGWGDARLLLRFDDDDGPQFHNWVDLSPLLAEGGVFEPLRDPNIFQRVQIGPHGRTLIWQVGESEDDVVDLSADVLWPMARSLDTKPAAP